MSERERPPIPRAMAIRIVVTLALVSAAFLMGLSIIRAGDLQRGYDFHHFYLDARYLIEHGELNTRDDLSAGDEDRSRLPWYLPFAVIAFTPFAAAGPWIGGVLWVTLNTAALLAVIWLVGRRISGLPASDWILSQAVPVWLCGAAIYEHARFNQTAVLVLLLVVVAYVLLEKRHDGWAGLALAAACLIKLLPALFVVWLALKRRWRAVAVAVVAAATLEVAPSLVLFGPAKTVEYHRRWARNALVYGSAVHMLMHPDDAMYVRRHRTFIDYRNQSLAMVIGRVSGVVGGFRQTSSRTLLNPAAAVTAYVVINAVVAGLLLWLSRKPWWKLRPDQRACELALWLLAMLWFSPLMRQYYLVWAYPALAVLLARADLHGQVGRSGWPAWTALVVWLVGMFAWGLDQTLFDHAARSLGVNLWSVLVLGVMLAVEWGRPAPPALAPDSS